MNVRSIGRFRSSQLSNSEPDLRVPGAQNMILRHGPTRLNDPLAAWCPSHYAAPTMPLLGAHQSIAGGYYKAVEIAHRTGCDCVQLFTKNNNQWRAKPITPDEAKQFRDKLAELDVSHPLSHDSYLINLGSPDDELWKKSIDAF